MGLSLGIGSRILLDNKTLVFSHSTTTDDRIFRDELTGDVYKLSDTQVFEKFLDGSATLNLSKDGKAPDSLLSADFSTFPDKDQKIARRRLVYVKALMALQDPRPQSVAWKQEIERVANANVATDPAFAKRPGWQTVRPWLKSYKESNNDIRSLLPCWHRCGRKRKERKSDEEGFLAALIQSWLTHERLSREKFYRRVKAAYKEARVKIPGAKDWHEPSKSWLRRKLDKLDKREIIARRYGPKAASDMFDHGGTAPAASYPLQVVEIDHTRLDLNVVDPDRAVLLGRPWLTVAIDRFTRMIVGVYIGFEPPSIYSVTQCLKNVIKPKTWMQRRWPEMSGRWEAYGMPILVLVDNGAEFKSRSFQEIAANLDMTIRLAPVKVPEYKGVVERFFRTIEESCLSGLPGRTFSNTKVRGTYDPQKHATLTLEDFTKYFHFWMLAEYVWKTHSEIMAVPAMRWREAKRTWTPALPRSMRDLDVILGRRDEATLTKTGVVFKKIRYQSEELSALYRAHRKQDRKVVLKVDDGDLGKIYVIHPASRRPVPALAKNRKYANGLTLFSHLQILKTIAARNKNIENSEEALAAKKDHFILYESLLRSATAKNRAKLARSIADQTVPPNFDLIDSVVGHVSPEAVRKIDAEMLDLPLEDDSLEPERSIDQAADDRPTLDRSPLIQDSEEDALPDAPVWKPQSQA